MKNLFCQDDFYVGIVIISQPCSTNKHFMTFEQLNFVYLFNKVLYASLHDIRACQHLKNKHHFQTRVSLQNLC